MNDEDFGNGVEIALELCLVKIREAKDKEEAYAKVNELLTLSKNNKMAQFEKRLWTIKF